MYKIIDMCSLCPRHCKVNRARGEKGYCRAGSEAKIALVSLHKWEEPCIAGANGAGTVFFSHCTLHCEFCQNYTISAQGYGVTVNEKRLAEIFLQQQTRGATCLELVTPTHYAPIIIHAIAKARSAGLSLPVVYNTNAYMNTDVVDMLSPYVDVFLPDLKYFDDKAALQYSHAPHYFQVASAAIKRMFTAKGPVQFKNTLLKKGILVRHLILPWLYKDSIKIVNWLWSNFGDDIYISLMNQYIPSYNAEKFPKINRSLTTYEYQQVINAALDLGISHCFVQEKSAASTKFVPNFNGSGVIVKDSNDK